MSTLVLLMFLVFDLILAFGLPLLALISNSVPIPVLAESAAMTMIVQAVVTGWILELSQPSIPMTRDSNCRTSQPLVENSTQNS